MDIERRNFFKTGVTIVTEIIMVSWNALVMISFATKKLVLPKRCFSCVLLLVFFASCSLKEKGYTSKGRPNIIVIVADDLGWKDVGYQGSEIKTPTLDKMAAEGVVFDRFYVHSVCSPTRASLLTGRMPTRFGIFTPLGDEAAFPKETVTIAELLRKNGYETAISGKWHLGTIPESRPLNFGFDSSYGYLRGQIDPFTHLYKNGDRTWHRNDQLLDEEGHATDLITEEAIRIIKKPRGENKPFFLYIAYSVPHYPLDEPEEWVKEYTDIIKNESRRKFAASVTHMDHSIGQLLSTLDGEEIDENTVILFLSDNGGQKRWYSETDYNGKFEGNDVLGNNLPLRDWKTSLYDGALRVPAMLYWPGAIEHQTVIESINVADVFPTFAHLAGVTVNKELNIEGENFWPAIEGEELSENRVMYWRTKNSIALKKGDWKLILQGVNLEKDCAELYNITLDPNEEKDIAKNYLEKVEELKNEMVNQMQIDKNEFHSRIKNGL